MSRAAGPWCLCLLVSFASVFVSAQDEATPRVAGEGAPAASPAPPTEIDVIRELERKIVATVEKTKRAFVFIEGGSGFLISADGYVLTNDHVVGRRNESVVQLTTGRNHRARVVGRDPEGDVALLRIDDEGPFPFLELGDSSKLRVGDQVVALGDPFLVASMNLFLGGAPPDLEPSASFGVVSALHRYSDTYSDAIQVDVAVNRGNSGGPLITLDGKAVGINGKIETRFAIGINSGVGYAVPSNQILNFLDALKAANGGRVEHGSIAGLYVDERSDGDRGLPIRKVDSGSTAEKVGLREGDRIASIEGLHVPTRNRYKGILSTFPVGREVTVTVVRADRAPAGADEGGLEMEGGEETREGAAAESEWLTLGFRVPIEPKGAAYLGVKMLDGPSGGVLVEEVVESGPADEAGIEAGDVILIFRGRRVGNVQELERLLKAASPGDEAQIGVMRDGKLVGMGVLLGGGGTDETVGK